jgi:hypothetical protein
MTPNDLFDKHALLTLTSKSINIQGEEGYALISMQVISGTVTVTGATGLTMGGELCGPVSFTAGMAFTFGTGESTVDDLTIDATSGSAIIAGVKVKNPN